MKLPGLRFHVVLFTLVLVAVFSASATSAIIRVKWDSPNNGPGNDWAHAYRTVTAAIAASVAGDEIWVSGDAGHPYLERITLKEGVGLYGGFAGGEVTREERQWRENETILDGSQGGSVVKVEAGATAATVLSGFTIRGGKATAGGGVFCNGASPTLLNNTITGNTATSAGAGLYIAASRSLVANCLFSRNTATHSGGAIFCSAGAARFINNTIVSNSSAAQGAFILSSTSAVLANNIVAFNSGGIARGGGNPTLNNNCVFGNIDYNYFGFDQDPTGTDGNISLDPLFEDREAGNYRLAPASPCIGLGSNAHVTPGWQDLDGQPRIRGLRADIGAYEMNPRIIRVNWQSPLDGPGSSWENAYLTVTKAVSAAIAGTEIWVAGSADHRYLERLTLRKDIILLGGFAGVETTSEERDPAANETVLDGTDGNYVILVEEGATATAVVDGFTITRAGAGVSCYDSSPTITNNVIGPDNSDGVRCNYYSSPVIRYNRIYGSGFRGVYCTWYSSPVIENNEFSDAGYGVYCSQYSAPSISNNTFSQNGSGITCSYSSPRIANNTISGTNWGIELTYSSPLIANNIIAFSRAGISGSHGSPVIRNNCLYNPEGKNDGSFGPGEGDFVADPKFQSAAYGKLHIQPDSPCVDAGVDTVVLPGSTDIDGQARVQGAHVDVGADESDGTAWPEYTPAIIRVSPSGVDNSEHDGSSWELAKRTVQAGIDAASVAGGDVWIAAGVYPEHIVIPGYCYVYGGFSGTESSRDQRNWTVNKSIIDGGGTDDVVTVFRPWTRLDGCTVRNSGSLTYDAGIDISSLTASTICNNTISDCRYGIHSIGLPTIKNNTISGNEEGIYTNGSPMIVDNSISGNTQNGIYCYSHSAASIIDNSIFGNGLSGIYCTNGSPQIVNNIIAGNGTEGVKCYSGSSPTITNNSIADNVTHGISCELESSPLVSNNIVAFSATGIRSFARSFPVLRNNNVFCPSRVSYEGLLPGAGDIFSDPLFLNRDAGDYHIKPSSACINAGLNSAPGLPLLDFDGQGRIFGGRVDIGADEWWSANLSIPDVKGAPDGAIVSGDGSIVTAAWPDAFYIEADSRASGIRVERLGHGLGVGQRATISGKAATNADGEKFIAADSAIATGEGVIEPLVIRNRSLGGGDLKFGWLTVAGQKGVYGSIGLNNIGLLVTTSGLVYAPRTPSGWFYIDDGSGASDGSGTPGIYVDATGLVVPARGQFATVTGISSCEWYKGKLVNVLRPRSQDDITAWSSSGDSPPPPPFLLTASPRQ